MLLYGLYHQQSLSRKVFQVHSTSSKGLCVVVVAVTRVSTHVLCKHALRYHLGQSSAPWTGDMIIRAIKTTQWTHLSFLSPSSPPLPPPFPGCMRWNCVWTRPSSSSTPAMRLSPGLQHTTCSRRLGVRLCSHWGYGDTVELCTWMLYSIPHKKKEGKKRMRKRKTNTNNLQQPQRPRKIFSLSFSSLKKYTHSHVHVR